MTRLLILFSIGFLHSFFQPAFGQISQKIPFDSSGTIYTIHADSRFAGLWIPIAGEFRQIEIFQHPDSSLTLEVFRTDFVRESVALSYSMYKIQQQKMDSLIALNPVAREYAEPEDRSDLEFDFLLGHVGYSAIHSVMIPNVAFRMNSIAAPLILSGSAYFLASSLVKNQNLTRANVAGSIEGHFNGMVQGSVAWAVLEAEPEVGALLFSGGGLTHAWYSFNRFSDRSRTPSVAYLETKAELYSTFWPWLFSYPLTKDSETGSKIALATGLGLGLANGLWADRVFNLSARNMSLGDAMLVEDYHLNSIGTMWGVLILYEDVDPNLAAPLIGAASLAGFWLGIEDNQNRGYSYDDARLIKRFIYGGALIGLGASIAVEADRWGGLMAVSGAWAGYIWGKSAAGKKSDNRLGDNLTIRFSPENYLVAKMIDTRDLANPVSLPVFSLGWVFN